MPTFFESRHTAEFLLSEAPGQLSRDNVVIAAAAPAMLPGQLLGRITASGKYIPCDPTATDGSQVARGALYAAAPDVAVDQKGVIVNRNAEFFGEMLTGLTTTARSDLLALGIAVR